MRGDRGNGISVEIIGSFDGEFEDCCFPKCHLYNEAECCQHSGGTFETYYQTFRFHISENSRLKY
jgi:hypothetical protein